MGALCGGSPEVPVIRRKEGGAKGMCKEPREGQSYMVGSTGLTGRERRAHSGAHPATGQI